MSILNAAFLGVAHIHTPQFIKMLNERAQAGEVQVKYVWDSNPARAQKVSDQIPGSEVAQSADQILNDASIDAVVVCAETNAHKDLVIGAANAKKAIFCEKPLGVGADDAQAMAEAIEAAGVVFQTGFFQRGASINQFIKSIVAQGKLGKITRAHFENCHGGSIHRWFDGDYEWFTDAKLAGGGALLDMGAHPLDLIIDLFGDTNGGIVKADGAAANCTGNYGGKIDEYGTGLLTFDSGLQVTFEASWADPGPLHLPVSIFGTEGQILVANDEVYFQSTHVDGADGKSPLPKESFPKDAPHAFQLFWDHLLGKSIPIPLVSVRQAALGSSVMEQIYNSAGRSTTTGI